MMFISNNHLVGVDCLFAVLLFFENIVVLRNAYVIIRKQNKTKQLPVMSLI